MKAYVIKRRPGSTIEDRLGLASYTIEFDRDGVAVAPNGARVHREADAALCRSFKSLEVMEVDATEADFQGGVDSASARLAVLLGPTRLAPPIGRLSPPSVADLLQAYGRDIDQARAEAIAEAELEAAKAGLFPYGLKPRVAGIADEGDDQQDEGRGASEGGTSGGDDNAGTDQPPPSYRQIIEERLNKLLGHGGGEELRALADLAEVRGTSKNELAEGIRAKLGDAELERALFDLIQGESEAA